jgi:hypothetical protein
MGITYHNQEKVMKIKRQFTIILLAVFTFLAVSIACSGVNNLPFIATPTFTSTPTSTPTLIPTSTPTFTPTATLLPKFSAVSLQQEDLPAGFQLVPNDMSHPDTQEFYAFANAKNFQIISGGSMLIATQTDQLGFEMMLNNPDILLQVIAAGDKSSEFKNIVDIPEMDKFGDMSKGFSADVNTKGLVMKADFFFVEKGTMGAFILSMYRPGKSPSMTIQEMAKILSERLNKMSNSSGGQSSFIEATPSQLAYAP